MIRPHEAKYQKPDPADRIVVALDVATAAEAREVVEELSGKVGGFKIGLQLFSAAGPGLVRELTAAGYRIFLDLKFHDIPNTVAKAGVEAARLGVWMFNIHALGGSEMMSRTADEVHAVCDREGLTRPLIIGVTVLTSANDAVLDEVGIGCGVESEVASLALLAERSGLDGVVASPHEIQTVRQVVTKDKFLIVTPGIRINFATGDDQKRVTSFRSALARGSDYVVIGRPILQAADRSEALKNIIGEVGTAD